MLPAGSATTHLSTLLGVRCRFLGKSAALPFLLLQQHPEPQEVTRDRTYTQGHISPPRLRRAESLLYKSTAFRGGARVSIFWTTRELHFIFSPARGPQRTHSCCCQSTRQQEVESSKKGRSAVVLETPGKRKTAKSCVWCIVSPGCPPVRHPQKKKHGPHTMINEPWRGDSSHDSNGSVPKTVNFNVFISHTP